MDKEIYAEDAPYWGTAVPAEETLAEIMGMLLSAGVTGFQPQKGILEGRPAWALRFPWRGRTIRIIVKALVPRSHSTKVISRQGRKQQVNADTLAEWQALRHLRHMLKPILEMAIFHPTMGDILFGFAELPEASKGDGYIPTVVDVIDAMPALSNEYLLAAPVEGEFVIINEKEG